LNIKLKKILRKLRALPKRGSGVIALIQKDYTHNVYGTSYYSIPKSFRTPDLLRYVAGSVPLENLLNYEFVLPVNSNIIRLRDKETKDMSNDGMVGLFSLRYTLDITL
jgi:hypothetical protein